MSDPHRFYARTRMTEARLFMRRTTVFEGSVAAQEVITSLIEDLCEDLASHAHGREEEAFDHLIRCLAKVVEDNSKTGFVGLDGLDGADPFGLDEPAALLDDRARPMWKWPVIHHGESSGTAHLDGDFRQFSALKMFGYTVGKTAGWAQDRRERFLSDFMDMALPSIVEAQFGAEYGSPSSTERLRKLAYLIATNASNFVRNDPARYAAAIDDWEADLAFLKRKYYHGQGLAFQPWPSTRPAIGGA